MQLANYLEGRIASEKGFYRKTRSGWHGLFLIGIAAGSICMDLYCNGKGN